MLFSGESFGFQGHFSSSLASEDENSGHVTDRTKLSNFCPHATNKFVLDNSNKAREIIAKKLQLNTNKLFRPLFFHTFSTSAFALLKNSRKHSSLEDLFTPAS